MKILLMFYNLSSDSQCFYNQMAATVMRDLSYNTIKEDRDH